MGRIADPLRMLRRADTERLVGIAVRAVPIGHRLERRHRDAVQPLAVSRSPSEVWLGSSRRRSAYCRPISAPCCCTRGAPRRGSSGSWELVGARPLQLRELEGHHVLHLLAPERKRRRDAVELFLGAEIAPSF